MKKIELNGTSEKIRDFGKSVFMICLLAEIIFAVDKRTVWYSVSSWNIPLFTSIGIVGLVLFAHPVMIKIWNVVQDKKSRNEKDHKKGED